MSLAGKLLTSPPNIKGNFWSKTVIFVTEDHAKGSVGFVLNKPTKMSIKEFSFQHGIESDVPGVLHVGGPVNVNALTVLHSADWECSNTMKITDDFSISSSGDLLLKFALGDRPKHYRMFAGLCAWAPDQLDSEIKGRPPYNHDLSWLTSSSSIKSVFGLDEKEQWTTSIEKCSMEFAQSIFA